MLLLLLLLLLLLQWMHVLSPVHTGNKVEFNTVDFVESRQNRPCRFAPHTHSQQSRPYRRQSTSLPICRRFRQQSTLSPVCTGLYSFGYWVKMNSLNALLGHGKWPIVCCNLRAFIPRSHCSNESWQFQRVVLSAAVFMRTWCLVPLELGYREGILWSVCRCYVILLRRRSRF